MVAEPDKGLYYHYLVWSIPHRPGRRFRQRQCIVGRSVSDACQRLKSYLQHVGFKGVKVQCKGVFGNKLPACHVDFPKLPTKPPKPKTILCFEGEEYELKY